MPIPSDKRNTLLQIVETGLVDDPGHVLFDLRSDDSYRVQRLASDALDLIDAMDRDIAQGGDPADVMAGHLDAIEGATVFAQNAKEVGGRAFRDFSEDDVRDSADYYLSLLAVLRDSWDAAFDPAIADQIENRIGGIFTKAIDAQRPMRFDDSYGDAAPNSFPQPGLN